ncbi:hypothetical protein OIDMADRAFT_58255 [Oidiodendron maius Zn]|uniref:NmrA-like domain-containing protein n=1 Tax=Oidiodendron maius (strain Zn) TaxID=913774 RepID=A0A0C3D431_OIDMZ|nr:hypothetical protein OIDMADRAFT_58255 [Oidiodendron maius Zn]
MTSHSSQVVALEENSFPSNSKSSELHLRFAELCGIDTDSTAGNNPYLTAVQLIVQLEAVEPGVTGRWLKAFPLAGDSLNFQEMNKIFHEEVGHNLPMAPGFLVSLFFYFSNDFGKMVRWFKEGGYHLDLDHNEEFPGPIDFRTWLRIASK